MDNREEFIKLLDNVYADLLKYIRNETRHTFLFYFYF